MPGTADKSSRLRATYQPHRARRTRRRRGRRPVFSTPPLKLMVAIVFIRSTPLSIRSRIGRGAQRDWPGVHRGPSSSGPSTRGTGGSKSHRRLTALSQTRSYGNVHCRSALPPRTEILAPRPQFAKVPSSGCLLLMRFHHARYLPGNARTRHRWGSQRRSAHRAFRRTPSSLTPYSPGISQSSVGPNWRRFGTSRCRRRRSSAAAFWH